MPYIHNFKEQILLTANCFNKINFQTISSITIDFYIVSFLKEGVCPLTWQTNLLYTLQQPLVNGFAPEQ